MIVHHGYKLIVKDKPNIVYWSDPKSQRKLFKPQNLVYKNFV